MALQSATKGLVVLPCLLLLLIQAECSKPHCGTLDLSSPLTEHCFPEDGSHHFVCCVGIQQPGNSRSPHGNYNPLKQVIEAASQPSSYSWCTCSEEICEQQLHGRVDWNMNGKGWKGYQARESSA